MTAAHRTKQLALSLLLPALYLASVVGITLASFRVGDSDRAIVWVAGTHEQLAAASLSLQANEWFDEVGVAAAGEASPVPAECPAQARQLSIGGLRQEEAQAARELIEAIAQDNGARVCRSHMYVINESHAGRASPVGALFAGAVLESGLLPLSLVLASYLALARHLGLGLGRGPTGAMAPARQVALALAAALGWWLAVWLLEVTLRQAGAAPMPETPWSAAVLGPGLVLGIVVTEPLLWELSFRAWMLPLAQRALGSGLAATVSTLAFAAAQLPAGAADLVSALLLGGINAALFLRTRSILAGTLVGMMASASRFLPV